VSIAWPASSFGAPTLKAWGVHRPGFFAEYASADHRQAFSVEGLERDSAVFAEPAACAMHGLETLDLHPGGSALVLGAGPTGLLLAQLIGSGGATSITVADIVPFTESGLFSYLSECLALRL
jgi:D-arabinitol dehydrogenase (NADP+)